MPVEFERGMLANPRDHRITRYLRLILFSFVAAILLVSLLIILISFVWDQFLAPALNRAPYAPRIEFIAPSIVLIALILAKILWDASEGKAAPSKTRKP